MVKLGAGDRQLKVRDVEVMAERKKNQTPARMKQCQSQVIT